MSHFYLLATGLLTQGSIAGANPEPPLLPKDTPPVLLDSHKAEFFQRETTYQAVPSVEFPTLEFSPGQLSEFSRATSWLASKNALSELESLSKVSQKSSIAPNLEAGELAQFIDNSYTPAVGTFVRPEVSLKSTEFSNFATPKPASGTQLYHQRVAALEAGQIYTRLAANKFLSSWVKANEKPTYQQWKRLLELEAKAIADGRGVNRLAVLVGDSLTLWFPQERLPAATLWLNQGISGDNSSGILKRLSALKQTNPDAIYVLAGINDLKQGATERVILSNIQQIVRRLRQEHPQAETIVQSILPTRLATISNSRVRAINRKISIIALQEGATYLDLHSRFVDVEGDLREDLTTDGLHLNQRGYEVWQLAIGSRQSAIAFSLQQNSNLSRSTSVRSRYRGYGHRTTS